MALVLLACRALNFVRPFLGTEQVEEKFHFFAEHRDEFDTLFIGSSRVNRQIDPKRFDAVLAARDIRSRSFNFGVDAMFAPEDQFICDRILSLRPRRLRTVFLEVSLFARTATAAAATRSVYFHDWARTALGCRMILEDEQRKAGEAELHTKRLFSWRKLRQRGRLLIAGRYRCWTEWSYLLQRTTNLGRGSELLKDGLDYAQDVPPPDNPVEFPTGFAPLPGGIGRAKHIDLFRSELEAVLKRPSKQLFLSETEEQNLHHIVKAIREAGAEPVLIMSPVPTRIVYYPRNPGAPVFDFSNPRVWPDLYKENERRDITHLNPEGAARYSRILAECWAQLQAKQKPAGG